MRAGAEVDAVDKDGWTPLGYAVVNDRKENAGYFLDVGAKVSKLKDLDLLEWFAAMVAKRKNCVDSCCALYGVLRKRWTMADGTRVSRDMVNMLTQQLWESRRDEQWAREN